MKELTIISHPMWDAQLCCMFAGIIMGAPQAEGMPAEAKEMLDCASKNFRKLYRGLTAQERVFVREEIAAVKADALGSFDEFAEAARDMFSDPNYQERIKNSPL